jgi:hypothetical protein
MSSFPQGDDIPTAVKVRAQFTTRRPATMAEPFLVRMRF